MLTRPRSALVFRDGTMNAPLVGIIMGSKSDWETMRHAAETLAELGVEHETRVVSAHRTPKRLYEYAHSARERGLKSSQVSRLRIGLPHSEAGARFSRATMASIRVGTPGARVSRIPL